MEAPKKESRLTAGSAQFERKVLLLSIFVAGLCSIIYELLIGTTSTYFLGDSVKHFSITVGIYMAAMGLGSYLSRFMKQHLVANFILVEIILAFCGGVSVPVLYLLFSWDVGYMAGMIFCIFIIGVLTGFEIPLLSRILSDEVALRENLSNVLSLDYIGALIATLCFPFLILPFVGLFKTSLIFGLINLGIGVINIRFLKDRIQSQYRRLLRMGLWLTGVFIALILLFSNALLAKWEQGLYTDRIIDVRQTPYQRIVLTKRKNDVRLYLEGNLQFSSLDEYRYHEVLVHGPMSLSGPVGNVLILGGGDGLAARELLKYKSVQRVTIVDLDPEVQKIANENPHIRSINEGSLEDSRVNVMNEDAFQFMRSRPEMYDLIIADLPDPNNVSLSRMYSKEFYNWVHSSLKSGGIFVTQASSPLFSSSAFWSIEQTLRATKFVHTYPLHAYVPSFGDWGFVMASDRQLDIANPDLISDLKFLDKGQFASLFTFSTDHKNAKSEVNTIDRPILSKLYHEGWKQWK
ncbi:MAG: polyamine aminopropyltransferase [Cytophagales bacterium]|nr:polyamine aminopropyltransferase [Cytophagales bacterium]